MMQWFFLGKVRIFFKRNPTTVKLNIYTVAPRAGAWIETQLFPYPRICYTLRIPGKVIGYSRRLRLAIPAGIGDQLSLE